MPSGGERLAEPAAAGAEPHTGGWLMQAQMPGGKGAAVPLTVRGAPRGVALMAGCVSARTTPSA
jgi:hypothetical protein